jgi:hypothetical protein
MIGYLMRETLIDALLAGPPHQVLVRHAHATSRMQILTELERRGLITSGPFPVLTQAGIAEAQWFTRSGSEENENT